MKTWTVSGYDLPASGQGDLAVPVAAADLPLVDTVTAEVAARQEGAAGKSVVTASGRVGR
jgi:hypothetical protein